MFSILEFWGPYQKISLQGSPEGKNLVSKEKFLSIDPADLHKVLEMKEKESAKDFFRIDSFKSA